MCLRSQKDMQYNTVSKLLVLAMIAATASSALPTYAARGSTRDEEKREKNAVLNIKLPLLSPTAQNTATSSEPKKTQTQQSSATSTPAAPPAPGPVVQASSTPPVANAATPTQKPGTTPGTTAAPAMAAAAPEHSGWINPYTTKNAFTPLQSAAVLLLALCMAVGGTLFVQGVALESAYEKFVRTFGVKAPPRRVSRHA
jgi:hypothetical protein